MQQKEEEGVLAQVERQAKLAVRVPMWTQADAVTERQEEQASR